MWLGWWKTVAKCLSEGHFFRIWPQSWPRNWWGVNVMHARNTQFVLPTGGKNMPLSERRGSTLTVPSEPERERREQVYWWCPQTLDEMRLSREGLHHMKMLLTILDFFQNLGKKRWKGESSWTVALDQSKTRGNWCGFASDVFCCSCRGR